MVRKKAEIKTALLENILAQPEAIRAVARQQLGPGRDAIVRCAEMLHDSKRIVLSGMGASLFSSVPLSYELAERGVDVSAIESSELLYFLLPTVGRDTAVVLVSRSGESVEITKLLPLLKERGCRVIGVVNVQESTLARGADQALVVNSPPDQLVAIQTYTGTLAALGLVGAAYAEELASAEEEMEATAALIERMMPECLENAASWESVSEDGSRLYLLGRGAALAAANAGALLMHEVAKRPAVAMSAAQFRHGPVEVVDKHFHAIVFTSQPATVDLDLRFAEDLSRLGGDVRRLGCGSREAEIVPVCEWPEAAPKRFRSILEIVPLQLLAYEIARARGVALGKFRFAPTVTLSEIGFLE